jgi:hypothetical protein
MAFFLHLLLRYQNKYLASLEDTLQRQNSSSKNPFVNTATFRGLHVVL